MRLANILEALRGLIRRNAIHIQSRWSAIARSRRGFRRMFRRGLVIEGLEFRRPLAFSIASSGNSITLTGDAGDNGVVISVSSSGHFQHDLPLSENLVSAIDTNDALAGEQAIVSSSVDSITIIANAGNDTIDAIAWTGVGPVD